MCTAPLPLPARTFWGRGSADAILAMRVDVLGLPAGVGVAAAATAAATSATAEATSTATSTTTPATATTTACAFGFGSSFVGGDGPAAEVFAVHPFDGLSGLVIAWHFDEAEAPAAAGVAVDHDLHASNGTESAELLLELGLCAGPGEVANINIHDTQSLLARRLKQHNDVPLWPAPGKEGAHRGRTSRTHRPPAREPVLQPAGDRAGQGLKSSPALAAGVGTIFLCPLADFVRAGP